MGGNDNNEQDDKMEIKDIETIEQLTEIVAGLVKQGLTFIARPGKGQTWNIELTGGY